MFINKTFSALADVSVVQRDGCMARLFPPYVGREIRSLGRLFAANVREGKEKTI
ncbi:MAG: hypothetical protein K0Q73_5667 [Paenibacillus sp.]|jgi:hypothetical protein|nr:hypothetical protein [Paenibacillus sp.]